MVAIPCRFDSCLGHPTISQLLASCGRPLQCRGFFVFRETHLAGVATSFGHCSGLLCRNLCRLGEVISSDREVALGGDPLTLRPSLARSVIPRAVSQESRSVGFRSRSLSSWTSCSVALAHRLRVNVAVVPRARRRVRNRGAVARRGRVRWGRVCLGRLWPGATA